MKGLDYVLRRVAFGLITLFVAITLNFVLFRAAPGDAVTNLSRIPHATEDTKRAVAQQFGLDKSKWQQYWIYLGQLARGNLGISFQNSQPVSKNLRDALSNTVPMVLLGTGIAIVLGTITGVIAATLLNRRADRNESETAITAGEGLKLGVLVFGLLRAIASLSDEEKK